MEEITENEKQGFKNKLNEFQLNGLKSYGKYLDEQYIFAQKKDVRKSYLSYIEDQIAMNNEKIRVLESAQ